MKENNKKNNATKWVPLLFIQLYLSSVLILFILGPWPWPLDNEILTIFYILTAQFMIFLGYYTAIKISIAYPKRKKQYIVIPFKKIEKKVSVLLKLYVFIIITSILYRFIFTDQSFSYLLYSSIEGILNSGKQYNFKIENQNLVTNTNYILLVFNIVNSILKFLTVPIVVVYWRFIGKRYKWFITISILVDLMYWISLGTNKGIFDLLFLILFSYLIKYYLEKNKEALITPNHDSNFKKIRYGKVMLIVCIFISIIFFTSSIESRMGYVNTYNQFADIHVDEKSVILLIFPEGLKNSLIIISSYLTQGYYGLSLALKTDFDSTLGFGNSFFLMSIYETVTGDFELKLNGYPYKLMEYGWSPLINWHSIYVWIGSDISLTGSLLFIFAIGYLLGETWRTIICNENIFAFGLFVLIMILLMYSPANNQIFSFIDTFITFWIIIWMWIRNKNVKIIN